VVITMDAIFGLPLQGRKDVENVRFQILTAASMKMTVIFWVVVPCSLVEVYRHSLHACCLHHQGSE
jgi:hypothetical protein